MAGLKDGLGAGSGLSGIEEEGSSDKIYTGTTRVYFRDAGLNIYSSTDGQLDIVADTTIALSGAVTMDSTLVAQSTVTVTTGVQSAAVARTATADGLTTGIVADGTTYVEVTSASADNIIVLPTPTPGNIVWLYCAANGYELRSDTPASVAINGGTGAGAESAIAAGSLVRCVCTSATTWVCSQFIADGTESKVEAAA